MDIVFFSGWHVHCAMPRPSRFLTHFTCKHCKIDALAPMVHKLVAQEVDDGGCEAGFGVVGAAGGDFRAADFTGPSLCAVV